MRDIDDAIKGIKEQRMFPATPDQKVLCERCFMFPVVSYPPDQTDLDQGIEIHREKYCATCMVRK